MGGSSLAPDILADTFGQIDGYPRLHVLDSTCPQQIKELEEHVRHSHHALHHLEQERHDDRAERVLRLLPREGLEAGRCAAAGRNFVAITDPGTTLDKEAKEESFRADFENDPNIGGRYSALSFVGIAPAAIAGYDINLLLDRALGAMHANDRTVDPHERAGRALRRGDRRPRRQTGATSSRSSRTPAVKAFGAWAEQLIAESTGKLGKGSFRSKASRSARPAITPTIASSSTSARICPIPNRASTRSCGRSRRAGHPVIRLDMNDEYDLGEQFYLWEIAVAAAGVILGINAFDQPNVQESKDNTVALLAQYARNGSFDEPKADVEGPAFDVTYLSGSRSRPRRRSPVQALAGLFAQLRPHDYNAITAYIARNRNARRTAARAAPEDSRRASRRDDGRLRPALPPFDRTAA